MIKINFFKTLLRIQELDNNNKKFVIIFKFKYDRFLNNPKLKDFINYDYKLMNLNLINFIEFNKFLSFPNWKLVSNL